MIYNWSISYLDKHSSTHVISVMQLNKTNYNTEQKGKEKKHIFKAKTKRGNIHSSCNRYSKVQLLKPHDYDIKSSQLVRPSIFSPRQFNVIGSGYQEKTRYYDHVLPVTWFVSSVDFTLHIELRERFV